MEPFIAQIVMFGGNFAPRGWAFCDGQLLSIAQNTALFSLLGTTYGGDGRTTFGLPDLRGRVPINPRTGPGLPPYNLGQKGGTTSETLNITQIPQHNHGILAKEEANSDTPTNNVVAGSGTSSFGSSSDANMAPSANSGGSQPHNNMQPYLAVNFIIALVGVYPSRN